MVRKKGKEKLKRAHTGKVATLWCLLSEEGKKRRGGPVGGPRRLRPCGGGKFILHRKSAG